jgi:putative hydrolase of the HAD superfamily
LHFNWSPPQGGNPYTSIFFDDSLRNVAAAKSLGLYSVLVGRVGVECACDLQITSMHDLPRLLPWLWDEPVEEPKERAEQLREAMEEGIPVAA